jgi:hypothetical protein
MRKQKSRKSASAASKEEVQKALEFTWALKGHIRAAAKQYLRVAQEIARARDEKIYEVLKNPTLEDYAEKRLGLSERSMYRYLQIYDWVLECHKQWLEPGNKDRIPDLAEVPDLIWLEKQLRRSDLDPETRAKLQDAYRRGLDGKLDRKEVRDLRRHQHKGKEGLKSALSMLRRDRKRCGELADVPSEVITHLDEAIEDLINAMHLERSAFALRGWGKYPTKPRRNTAKNIAPKSRIDSRLQKVPRVALFKCNQALYALPYKTWSSTSDAPA